MGTFLILNIVNEGCLLFRYSLLKTIMVILTSKELRFSVWVLLILNIVNEGCLVFRYSLLKTIMVILNSKRTLYVTVHHRHFSSEAIMLYNYITGPWIETQKLTSAKMFIYITHEYHTSNIFFRSQLLCLFSPHFLNLTYNCFTFLRSISISLDYPLHSLHLHPHYSTKATWHFTN